MRQGNTILEEVYLLSRLRVETARVSAERRLGQWAGRNARCTDHWYQCVARAAIAGTAEQTPCSLSITKCHQLKHHQSTCKAQVLILSSTSTGKA